MDTASGKSSRRVGEEEPLDEVPKKHLLPSRWDGAERYFPLREPCSQGAYTSR